MLQKRTDKKPSGVSPFEGFVYFKFGFLFAKI